MAEDKSDLMPPRKILFATDLSTRCDRALDRALTLAEEWDAELHVLHALPPVEDLAPAGRLFDAPWRSFEDPQGEAERRLWADIGPNIERSAVSVHVEVGPPGPTILEVAEREGCALIVTGVARNETLGRMILGDTVDFLLKQSRVPVLIVRERAHAPYESAVVATDFSAASREALKWALSGLQNTRLSIFHGFHIPFSGILINDDIRAEFRQLGEEAAQKFLATSGLPKDFPHTVAQGAPEELLPRHLKDRGTALLVIGSHGVSALAQVFLGRTARRIIDAASGDVLVVPFSGRSNPRL